MTRHRHHRGRTRRHWPYKFGRQDARREAQAAKDKRKAVHHDSQSRDAAA